MTPQERLERVADALDNAIRQGTEEDSPEGFCYITISDNLAKIMAKEIRESLDEFLMSIT